MARNKIVAIIIARQGSSRLPGKALSTILNKPVIEHIILRLQKMNVFNEICLATTNLEVDIPLLNLGIKLGVKTFGGHPDDVLDRLYNAAKFCHAEIIAEIGGDCPFIDPEIVNRAIELFSDDIDFVTNCEPQTFPDGLDIHLISFGSLKKLHENATLKSQRAHPFGYLHSNRNEFRILNFENSLNNSNLRWTLDFPEDFNFIKTVYEELYNQNNLFTMHDILALLRRKPEIGEINSCRNLVHTSIPIPSHWYTKAFIIDMLYDIDKLVKNCIKFEDENNFKELVDKYSMINKITDELFNRATHFVQNK